MREETVIIIASIVACLVIIIIGSAVVDTPETTVEVTEVTSAEPEPEPQEEKPLPRRWSAPMQRWFEAGNRIVVDYVHENGWCAIAIQRPPAEEGGEETIQCLK